MQGGVTGLILGVQIQETFRPPCFPKTFFTGLFYKHTGTFGRRKHVGRCPHVSAVVCQSEANSEI